jgi:hypothetical protein
MRAKKKGLPENEEHTSCAGAITDALDLSIHPSRKKKKKKSSRQSTGMTFLSAVVVVVVVVGHIQIRRR